MVALSEMSREALIRELRIATSLLNLERMRQIKFQLAKRKLRAKVEVKFIAAVKPRAYVDD